MRVGNSQNQALEALFCHFVTFVPGMRVRGGEELCQRILHGAEISFW